jgi:hypothetical protein
MPIDDRTTNRSYQLPNAGNLLAEDVVRLRAALAAIDADVFARYTKLEVDQLITNLINGAPGALNTLDELAAALGDDANYAATITSALANRYTKAEANTLLALKASLAGATFTGNINIPSLNGGPLAGMRNRIINGNFDIWQEGPGPFTGNQYGADQWISFSIGNTHSATRQPFTLGQTAVPGEPEFFCRSVISSVAGAGNYSVQVQRLEDVRTFAGQQVTVSFWAKADATKSIAVELLQAFGTGGSPSSEATGIGTTKVTIGTSWQKVTVTATMPSISGKTLGTDNNDFVTLNIWFDAGSTFNSRTASQLGSRGRSSRLGTLAAGVGVAGGHRPLAIEQMIGGMGVQQRQPHGNLAAQGVPHEAVPRGRRMHSRGEGLQRGGNVARHVIQRAGAPRVRRAPVVPHVKGQRGSVL